MTDPADIARQLHSLSGAIGEAARDIDHNGDLFGISGVDVENWINDLGAVQSAIEGAAEERGAQP